MARHGMGARHGCARGAPELTAVVSLTLAALTTCPPPCLQPPPPPSLPPLSSPPDTLRGYLKGCREEASRRIVERVYDASGAPNKHWLAYGFNKFLDRTLA